MKNLSICSLFAILLIGVFVAGSAWADESCWSGKRYKTACMVLLRGHASKAPEWLHKYLGARKPPGYMISFSEPICIDRDEYRCFVHNEVPAYFEMDSPGPPPRLEGHEVVLRGQFLPEKHHYGFNFYIREVLKVFPKTALTP